MKKVITIWKESIYKNNFICSCGNQLADPVDEINVKVRANAAKEAADIEAADYKDQYEDMTSKIENVRKEKMALLDGAELPLAGLSVEDGELTYNGRKWDSMSGSDQLKVSVAIVRKLNPECSFVLMDKLEQMDLDTLKDFGAWLEGENLQETGEARYDSQANKYAIICDGLMALLREKDDRDTKLQRRIQNKSAAVDKLIKDTYTKDEVVKIMNAAVYW